MVCCKPPEGQFEPDAKPMEDRKCTDVFCSIIFILVWAANIVIAVFAVGQGDLDSYFYGTDYQAQYCGKSGTDTETKSKVIMPRLDRDFYEQSATIASGAWWNFEPYKLCAEECPPKFTLKSAKVYGGKDYPNANDTAPSFFVPFETVDILGYCMPKADLEDGDVRQVCATPVCTDASVTAAGGTCTTVPGLEEEETTGLFAWEVCPPGTTDENCAAQKAVCELEVKEDTKVIFAPPTQTAASQSMTAQFAGYVYAVDEFARSLMGALPVLMTCSLLLPVVMGFLWAVLIYLFASFMVWFLLVTLVVFMWLCTGYCWAMSGWVDQLAASAGVDFNASEAVASATDVYADVTTMIDADAYKVMAIIGTVLSVLVLLAVVMWRKAINRCIAILKESAKMFGRMPMLMLWPIWIILGMAVTFGYWAVIAWFIFSAKAEAFVDYGTDLVGEVSSGASEVAEGADPLIVKTLIFVIHTFICLWTAEFVKACGWTTMSGAVAYGFFYMGEKAETSETTVRFPICNAMARVVRYHIGSMLFGSCIIAICQLIRYILATIDYYTKDLQQKNLLFKLVIKCAQCAAWCLQKTIEFISYYGYVYVAIDGIGFCQACAATFKFVAAHPVQTAVNKTVEKLLVMLISLTTPLICAFIAYMWLQNSQFLAEDDNPLYPTVMVGICAYFIADAIGVVFQCTIDTMYLCSFKDIDEYGGKHMSSDMRDAFGLGAVEGDAEREATPIQTAEDFKQHSKRAKDKSTPNLQPGPSV